MTITDWVDHYIAALPQTLRPSTEDSRFTGAALKAKMQGWTPGHAARIVLGRNYSNAYNPPLLAIMALEDVAGQAHQVARTRPTFTICPCGDDDCRRGITTPQEWVAERVNLIRELLRTPDMTEDERENCMSVLIADQHARART